MLAKQATSLTHWQIVDFESLIGLLLKHPPQCTVATHHHESNLAQIQQAKLIVHIDEVIAIGSSELTFTIKV